MVRCAISGVHRVIPRQLCYCPSNVRYQLSAAWHAWVWIVFCSTLYKKVGDLVDGKGTSWLVWKSQLRRREYPNWSNHNLTGISIFKTRVGSTNYPQVILTQMYFNFRDQRCGTHHSQKSKDYVYWHRFGICLSCITILALIFDEDGLFRIRCRSLSGRISPQSCVCFRYIYLETMWEWDAINIPQNTEEFNEKWDLMAFGNNPISPGPLLT